MGNGKELSQGIRRIFMDENQRAVRANDNDIVRQVPGITTEKEKKQVPNQLKDEELFFRAIGR